MFGRLSPLRCGAVAAAALLVLAGTAAAGTTPPGELAPLHGTYAPRIDPANFVVRIDNRYLPYEPGTRLHFEGVRGSTRQTDDQVVLRRSGRLTVRYGTFRRLLVTSELSPLEPQTEHKYYAPGVGEIAERVVKGHHEEFELVSKTRASAVAN